MTHRTLPTVIGVLQVLVSYIGGPWLGNFESNWNPSAVSQKSTHRNPHFTSPTCFKRVSDFFSHCLILIDFHIKLSPNLMIPNRLWSSKESIQTGDSAWFERVIQQLRGVLLERQNDAAVAAVEASARPPVLKAAPFSPKVAPVSTFPTARTEAWGRGGYDLVVAICNEVDVESKKLVNVLDLSNWGLHGFYGNRLRCKTSLYMPPPFLCSIFPYILEGVNPLKNVLYRGMLDFTKAHCIRAFCNRTPKKQSCAFWSIQFVRVLKGRLIL